MLEVHPIQNPYESEIIANRVEEPCSPGFPNQPRLTVFFVAFLILQSPLVGG